MHTSIDKPETTPNYLTVIQFCERHEWASIGGIRHLIFHEKTNGFSKCIRRIGRRILLDENAVFAWIEAGSR